MLLEDDARFALTRFSPKGATGSLTWPGDPGDVEAFSDRASSSGLTEQLSGARSAREALERVLRALGLPSEPVLLDVQAAIRGPGAERWPTAPGAEIPRPGLLAILERTPEAIESAARVVDGFFRGPAYILFAAEEHPDAPLGADVYSRSAFDAPSLQRHFRELGRVELSRGHQVVWLSRSRVLPDEEVAPHLVMRVGAGEPASSLEDVAWRPARGGGLLQAALSEWTLDPTSALDATLLELRRGVDDLRRMSFRVARTALPAAGPFVVLGPKLRRRLEETGGPGTAKAKELGACLALRGPDLDDDGGPLAALLP